MLEIKLRPCPWIGFCKRGNQSWRSTKEGKFLHYFVNLGI